MPDYAAFSSLGKKGGGAKGVSEGKVQCIVIWIQG